MRDEEYQYAAKEVSGPKQKPLEEQIASLRKEIAELQSSIRALRIHQHAQDGRVFVPMDIGYY
jgi:prefoldin subunit 5